MRAGELRRPITIQQVAYSADGAGGEGSPVWSTYTTTWAAVVPLSGTELAHAQQFDPRINFLVKIRYQSGVSPTMRVLAESQTLEIHVVLNVDERFRELHLMCEELNAS